MFKTTTGPKTTTCILNLKSSTLILCVFVTDTYN